MATMHQTQASACHAVIRPRASPECSIVVDDVDAGPLRIVPNTLQISSDDYIDIPSPSEDTTNRIKEFQRVAEGRKMEFALLLEEHAQVIRRLKQMEENDSNSNNNSIPAGTPSASA